jgi:hypothetical protein
MEQNRRKPRRRRMVLAAMVLVLLYVLSSGPLQFSHTVSAAEPKFADEGVTRCSDGSSANHLALNMNILGENGQPLWREDLSGVQVDFGPLVTRCAWWPRAYAPLIWLSRQSWGHWLGDYWGLFPIREPDGGAA